MKTRSGTLALAGLAAAMWLVPSRLGADAPRANPSVLDPVVEMRVSRRYVSLIDDIPIDISITNPNGTGWLGVSQFTLKPPGGFGGTSVVINRAYGSEYYPVIYHDQAFDTTVTLKRRHAIKDVFQILALRPPETGTVEARMLYAVSFDDSTAKDNILVRHMTFDYNTPAGVVVLGGFCGVALLSLFVAALDRFRKGWRELGMEILRGGIAATIVIIISKVTTGFELPIAIDVKSFAGGVIVGLLSTRFLVPLLAFLGVGEEESAAAKPEKKMTPVPDRAT